ncbi:hypothetical protein ACGFOU_00200 [Streptomyces sp. NPDC048595]|uniref:hypothetical protein n=1 Tax=Streptomyces sp. NPDC048595 TaxID=3365576 RepID=UPI003723D06E
MPTPSDARPTPAGRAAGIFGLLVALAICGVCLTQAAAASGLTGTGGKLTVSDCHSGRGGNGSTRHCYGTFRPTAADGAGSSADPRARVDTREAAPGDTIEVRKGSAGYVVAGMGTAWPLLAFAFLGLLLGSVALPVAVSGVLPRRGTSSQDVFAAVRGTRTAWFAQRLALTSVAGIAVSAYLAWLF